MPNTTASAPKAQKVGEVWELKVPAGATAFEVASPTGTHTLTVADGQKVVPFILDAPGEFTAVAHVDGSDNVGGFAVTAK